MHSRTVKRLLAVVAVAGVIATAGCPGKTNVTKIAVPPGGVAVPDDPAVSAVSQPMEKRPDVSDLAVGDVLEVPYILWGGDVATFMANGGETTQPGTTFAKHGLKLKLIRQDDFDAQVKKYKEGKSAFLRGTMSMLGQASEQIASDPRSQPVVFLQLTWSAGDHLVARAPLRTLADLKGKKIALQKGGPHVGMLNDILRTAQFSWRDVEVVWMDDVTGDNGPAAKFKSDPSIDACFAITPDMLALTGGADATGDGNKGTVKGAHVLVSTAQMLRSISDVYACRRDYFDAHKDVIEKFTAAYLKACEDLAAIKKTSKDKTAAEYKNVLALTRKMFGKDTPDDESADGLISDAIFVGLAGNYSFFQDKGNLSGFAPKAKAAVDLALNLGDAKNRYDLAQANLDYAQIKKLGDLAAKVDPPRGARFANDAKETGVLYSFFVYFEGGIATFPEAQYGKHFQRAVEQASLFGNAMISIRGHANGQELMHGFRSEVLKRKIVTQRGDKYFLKDGSEFAMNDMKAILDLIKKENLGGVTIATQGGPPTMQGQIDICQTLSAERSESVRRSVLDYATRHGYRVDQSQMKYVGVGCAEPALMFPATYEDGGKNRRVEFRISTVAAESLLPQDEYDF